MSSVRFFSPDDESSSSPPVRAHVLRCPCPGGLSQEGSPVPQSHEDMSYRYLTRSYVEWLGLPLVPIMKRRETGHWCGLHGTLPRPDSRAIAAGVIHDDSLYEREQDGLAFVRLLADEALPRVPAQMALTDRA